MRVEAITEELTMAQRTWFITGVSSGFGRELTGQLLGRGDRVVGTVRDTGKVADLLERYPETYGAELLDVTDAAAIRGLRLAGPRVRPARPARRASAPPASRPSEVRLNHQPHSCLRLS
jgi:hypothetical protein